MALQNGKDVVLERFILFRKIRSTMMELFFVRSISIGVGVIGFILLLIAQKTEDNFYQNLFLNLGSNLLIVFFSLYILGYILQNMRQRVENIVDNELQRQQRILAKLQKDGLTPLEIRLIAMQNDFFAGYSELLIYSQNPIVLVRQGYKLANLIKKFGTRDYLKTSTRLTKKIQDARQQIELESVEVTQNENNELTEQLKSLTIEVSELKSLLRTYIENSPT